MHHILMLRIESFPPAFNGKDGLLRMHWRTRQQHLEQWKERIWYGLSETERALFERWQFTHCEITFTRHTKHPVGLDWSNCASSLKIPEDAFVQLGILQDDNPGVVCGIGVRQVVGVKTRGKGNAFIGVEFLIQGTLSPYDRDEFMIALARGKKNSRE